MKGTGWHGRLSVQVSPSENDSNSPARSFSASFELTGTSEAGELIFLTPLGSTAATVQWNSTRAELVSAEGTRSFEGLGLLIQGLVGTDVPIPALFAWLDGRDLAVDGWQVDLTHFDQGKIAARRFSPPPQAQLHLVLEH
jgi:outer membrane lipoprotein LolB